jgi:polyisoprenoid-binding protein YceI
MEFMYKNITLNKIFKEMIYYFSLSFLVIIFSTSSYAQFFPIEMTPVEQMPSGHYKLDKSHASLTWKVKHLGLSNYTARFTQFDANLNIDVKHPSKSDLNVSICVMCLATDFPFAAELDFDQVLASGKEWFNGDRYPEITFKSKSIVISDKKTAKVIGDLTMLGKTHPVTLNVTFNGAYQKKFLTNVPALGFSATATLNRSDWGFTTLIPIVSDKVDIIIEAEFDKI